jgi:hypothetical protein
MVRAFGARCHNRTFWLYSRGVNEAFFAEVSAWLTRTAGATDRFQIRTVIEKGASRFSPKVLCSRPRRFGVREIKQAEMLHRIFVVIAESRGQAVQIWAAAPDANPIGGRDLTFPDGRLCASGCGAYVCAAEREASSLQQPRHLHRTDDADLHLGGGVAVLSFDVENSRPWNFSP